MNDPDELKAELAAIQAKSDGAPRALALNNAAFGTHQRGLWRTFKACTGAVDNFRHGPEREKARIAGL